MTDEDYKACTPRERFIYDLTQKWKTYVGSRGAQLSFETNFDELLKEFRDNFQKMEESWSICRIFCQMLRIILTDIA